MHKGLKLARFSKGLNRLFFPNRFIVLDKLYDLGESTKKPPFIYIPSPCGFSTKLFTEVP
jgi:hypothetical protein